MLLFDHQTFWNYFTGPILLVLLFQNFYLILPFLILTILLAVLFSPYSLILWPDFLSSMKYETGVASGRLPVFTLNNLPVLGPIFSTY